MVRVRVCVNDRVDPLDARDASEKTLALSLLGKSQTFHGRQRVGDIMARTTNDVHMLNLMISPAVWLITDATIGTLVPVIVLTTINPSLLLVPALWDKKARTIVSNESPEIIRMFNQFFDYTYDGVMRSLEHSHLPHVDEYHEHLGEAHIHDHDQPVQQDQRG